jgi:hypothetical protein
MTQHHDQHRQRAGQQRSDAQRKWGRDTGGKQPNEQG